MSVTFLNGGYDGGSTESYSHCISNRKAGVRFYAMKAYKEGYFCAPPTFFKLKADFSIYLFKICFFFPVSITANSVHCHLIILNCNNISG